MNLVLSEIMAQSKRIFETVYVDYTSQGRGALLVPLTKEHFAGLGGFSGMYTPETKLQSFGEVAQSVATYDPTTSFVVCVLFNEKSKALYKTACIHKDTVLPIEKSGGIAEPCITINTERCNYCSACTTTLAKCGLCKCTAYCSKNCQTKDWPDHKPICKTLQPWNVSKKNV